MKKNEELSFEEAMEQLEEIVDKLEQGDVPLEKAITYYQEGMELSKVCNEKLSKVQQKMVNIINEHGEIEQFDLQGEE
ncbi:MULTISPECIES: exodeoxyribonuclease VII small subunit [unclassified Virgibacillus]|uniref:exodeoxyribonuclease VII small subunit n=1 Tax=unclassified Virgibacillus TaxID=2620237 RepID=UPI0024DEC755|nr:exodeoxyribonuclease VII small subunit [Virgibacillus sp. LDC-1]